jgi:hypothetical protein
VCFVKTNVVGLDIRVLVYTKAYVRPRKSILLCTVEIDRSNLRFRPILVSSEGELLHKLNHVLWHLTIRILGTNGGTDQSRYFFFQVAPQLYSRG